ncbi:hypothetical protein L3Q82_019192, partial [Scortum barcoo]
MDPEKAMDEDAIKNAIENTTVGIYVLKEHASSNEPEDIGIVDNVALAVAILFRLMYALNFSYLADLRYTFEVGERSPRTGVLGKFSGEENQHFGICPADEREDGAGHQGGEEEYGEAWYDKAARERSVSP